MMSWLQAIRPVVRTTPRTHRAGDKGHLAEPASDGIRGVHQQLERVGEPRGEDIGSQNQIEQVGSSGSDERRCQVQRLRGTPADDEPPGWAWCKERPVVSLSRQRRIRRCFHGGNARAARTLAPTDDQTKA